MPTTIREVSERINRGDDRNAISDFKHDFLRGDSEQRLAMVADEPVAMDDERYGAYLAGLTEWLCRKYSLPVPEWVDKDRYYLNRPWFVDGFKNLTAMALVQSPAAFKKRNVFLTEPVMGVA